MLFAIIVIIIVKIKRKLNKKLSTEMCYFMQNSGIQIKHALLLFLTVCKKTTTWFIICLGRQTKQIMVAKFQSLMFLIANAESSPLF
jgi:hypothetical protein